MLSKRRPQNDVEMQMGPMIDIVFLLLIFFMVTAKPIKPESDVSIDLPGLVPQEEIIELPNEQRIEIKSNGQVLVNELPIDALDDPDLPNLTKLLTRFRESSTAAGLDALVTISAENGTKHQRLMDVMNACAKARLYGVTLSTEGAGNGASAATF